MAACVGQMKHKRQREKFSEDDENLQKRSRNGFLSDFFSTDDGDCDAVSDDLVLQAIKSLQEEISGISDKAKNSRLTSEVGERANWYEDLVNATDEKLGIIPSFPISAEENDNESISNKFWSDLFENPSNSTGESVDVLHPFLSHCYSYNYRGYVEYNSLLICEDEQEWMQEVSRIWPHRGF